MSRMEAGSIPSDLDLKQTVQSIVSNKNVTTEALGMQRIGSKVRGDVNTA